MATTISRTHYDTLVDNDGVDPASGSIWDKADVDALLDAVDAIIGNNVTFGGSIAERNRSIAMGAWQNVPFSAGNFTGAGSMTVTLTSGDQVRYRYMVIGESMWVEVDLRGIDIGGTPSLSIQIAIPGGFSATANNQGWNVLRVTDNGLIGTGFALVNNDGSGIQIRRSMGGGDNWTVGTGVAAIFGVIGPFSVS
jgi:hypothetical protein